MREPPQKRQRRPRADAVRHDDRQAVGQRVEAQVDVPAAGIVEVRADRLERGADRREQQRRALQRGESGPAADSTGRRRSAARRASAHPAPQVSIDAAGAR